MRSLISALLLIFLLPNRSAAEQPVQNIWGRPVMKQPFDKEPLRPIVIPNWVQQTLGCGYTMSVMSSAQREGAARHGVTLSEMNFVDPYYAYYDSQLLKRRSPYVPLGRLEQEIADYKRLGVKILGVYPPCLQGEVYDQHLDWRRIATDTTEIPQIDLKQFPHGGMLCLLGPYGDFFIEVLSEILQKYPDVAAFSFDGLHDGGVCYCQHCRENFRKDTGLEIPPTDMHNSEFRRYQHWADRRLEDLVRRMQTRLKGINSEIALVTWSTNAGRFGHFLSIPRNMPSRMNLLLDAPDQEFWMDETNRGATIVPAFSNAYIWATTNHRVAFSEPYILSHGNPYGKDSFPPSEIERRMLLAATYGAAPSIAVAQPDHLQQPLYDCMDQLQIRKPWLLNKRPEKWAAIVMSDNTRNFYGRSAGMVEERYMANVLGTFRAAVEEHLPVTVINDWNLNAEDLAEYSVLVLPNTACIDDEQAAAIREYVRSGGGLVASLDTSLFNEYGDSRENFLIADVLGVDFDGLPETKPAGQEAVDINFAHSLPADYWEKRKNVFHFQQNPDSWLNVDKMRTYVGPDPVTLKGPALRVKPNSSHHGEVLGTIYEKSLLDAERLPAVVTNQFGAGRVVYLAAGFDAAYYLYPYPYQRLVMKHAIQWAAKSPQLIKVEAPHCVHTTLTRQTVDGHDRLVLQLFNDLNTTAFHALPNEDIPLREETVPIHDIAITFALQYPIRSATFQPNGTPLKCEVTPHGTRIVVPLLEVHGIVDVELGEASQPANQ